MSSGLLRNKRNLMISTCVLAVGAGFGASAQAQTRTGSGAVLETVIVTAERRGTDVQRTPDAITAVPSRSLDENFITHINGLNGQVPSLQTTKTAGFENIVTIRGVGSETPENSLTTSPGVSQFIDGVYIANTISLGQTLFDVDRIEVLRGPQGALYGQSSIAGAINIISRQPKLGAYEGSGDFSYGTYNLLRERLAVNIPVSSTVAVRASLQKFDHEGFTKVVPLSPFREDDAHDGSAKLAVLWKPREDFSATLTAQLYKSNQHGDAQKNINDPDPDPRHVTQDYANHFALETQLYHLNLQWDGPLFSVRSVTAYQGLDHVQRLNGSRSTFKLLGAYDDIAAWNTHVHNYTEEFDILSPSGSKLEWIAGFFGLYQASKQYVNEFQRFGGPPPTQAELTPKPDISSNPPGNLAYGNISHVLRRSYSLFAQATFHATDQLRVTGGIRYNKDAFRDESYNFSAFGKSTVTNRYKGNKATWRVEADYDVTPDNMVYASYARGYKPGGVNGTGFYIIGPTFKPETNDAFELGAKNYFLDRSLRLNLAAFYYNQKNFQYLETDPFPFATGIVNIPKIRDYGVEAEVQYVAPDTHFRAGGQLSLTHGEVNGTYKTINSTIRNAIVNDPSFSSPCAFGGQFYNPACWNAIAAAAVDINGRTPPAMPKVTGSGWLGYRWDVAGGSLLGKVTYTYRGAMWARIFNEPGLDRVKSYGTTDLYAEYTPANSALRLSVAATNIFDKAGVNSRYTDPFGIGQTSQQYIPPRQVIGTIAYNW